MTTDDPEIESAYKVWAGAQPWMDMSMSPARAFRDGYRAALDAHQASQAHVITTVEELEALPDEAIVECKGWRYIRKGDTWYVLDLEHWRIGNRSVGKYEPSGMRSIGFQGHLPVTVLTPTPEPTVECPTCGCDPRYPTGLHLVDCGGGSHVSPRPAVKPDSSKVRHEIRDALMLEGLSACRDGKDCECEDNTAFIDRFTDAILALWPGKTEREVREEVFAEAKRAMSVHTELNAKLKADDRAKGATND